MASQATSMAPCPVCKHLANRLDKLRRGDHYFFDCPLCGNYEIGGSFAATLSYGEAQPVLSGIIRHSAERSESLGMIDRWRAEELEARAPTAIPEKATQLLEVIAKKAPGHGQMMAFNLATDYPLAYGTDETALRDILDHLREEGLIRGHAGAGKFECRITPKGWAALEVLGPTKPDPSPPPMNTDATPNVFISYSWDSDDHKGWVRELASRLRGDGIDTKLDQWEVAHGDRLPLFMERSIRENNFVLIVLTPNYKRKSDDRSGGVGYEGDIMTGEVFSGKDPRKFIPVLRSGTWESASPSWLKGKYGVDLTGDPYRDNQYHDLLSSLHRTREKAPPIGKRPATAGGTATAGKGTFAPPAPIVTSEPIRITGIVANEVGTPRNDGTAGSALYRVPFQLSRRPSYDWADHFVRIWDSPPSRTPKHRPGIAHVEGDRIILDGTTLEEVGKVHRETLKSVIEKVNGYIAEQEAKERDQEETRAEQLRQHKKLVENATNDISFG